MKDLFEELVEQLGTVLDVELHLDRNQIVALRVRDRLSLQLQEDREKKELLIISILCEVPPGRFRQDVLASALKTNSSHEDRPGNFGYLAMKDSLTLHIRYPLDMLEGKSLALLVSNFIDCAEQWQKAVQSGRVGP